MAWGTGSVPEQAPHPASTDLDDRLLPAATHLTDERSHDVVAPAVTAAGGVLHRLDPVQVLYRPGRELVVQYQASVSWGQGAATDETLLAGTTTDGAPPGTMPVVADDPDRGALEVGVWRYPFDPELPGLAGAVVAAEVSALLGSTQPPRLTVVSYRPCRRAVVRAAWDDHEVYVKVIRPEGTAALVERHRRLLAAGLPVPEVLAVDPDRGLVALHALPGADLRAALLGPTARPLPGGDALADLVAQIAAVDLGDAAAEARPTLVEAAPRHAAMLRLVAPHLGERLDVLLDLITAGAPAGVEPAVRTVHGDLHEAQLRIDGDGRIVGLLDVDDAGPGEPLDDLARAIGHLVTLTVLAEPGSAPGVLARLRAHTDRVTVQVATRADPTELRRRVGASLIGLATGPFRSQSPGWEYDVGRLLEAAERSLEMRRPSDPPHEAPIAKREN